MKPKELVIDISAEGEVTIEANGYTGKACTDATRALELALGKGHTQAMKPEAFVKVAAKATVGT